MHESDDRWASGRVGKVGRRHFLGVAAGSAAVLGLGGASAAATPTRHDGLRTGLDALIDSRYRTLRGQRVGVIANPTSVTPALTHEVDVMHASSDVNLVAVFGPEHGFRGTAQAGGSEGDSIDPRTGLPVYDLYAKSWQDMQGIFDKAGVDTLMFDIQDVGARFYTYIWTMYDAMTAAAATGRRFVVLDRPNPIGGERVAGPMLETRLETGVGKAPIAQQHGLTVGELAQLFAGEFVPDRAGADVHLAVVPMTGWRREQQGTDTGLRWVAPSPNIPTVTTAQVYAGLCYFEGTNLSQGRGTTQPFEIVGAPYLDERWSIALNGMNLPGALFREAAFAPTSNTYSGQVCRGVQTYVTDPDRFDAIRTAVAMLIQLKQLYPDFAWRYDTGDKIDPYWIDKLAGTDQVRLDIDAGKDVDAVVAGWQSGLSGFRSTRAKYLIYGRS
ncbi:MAG TPA: DUF1343 domain-containing protein [Jatrophihabitantaceae bacterium]|jgi:uncharacterized protein YbbC (DUF1343 family)